MTCIFLVSFLLYIEGARKSGIKPLFLLNMCFNQTLAISCPRSFAFPSIFRKDFKWFSLASTEWKVWIGLLPRCHHSLNFLARAAQQLSVRKILLTKCWLYALKMNKIHCEGDTGRGQKIGGQQTKESDSLFL